MRHGQKRGAASAVQCCMSGFLYFLSSASGIPQWSNNHMVPPVCTNVVIGFFYLMWPSRTRRLFQSQLERILFGVTFLSWSLGAWDNTLSAEAKLRQIKCCLMLPGARTKQEAQELVFYSKSCWWYFLPNVWGRSSDPLSKCIKILHA